MKFIRLFLLACVPLLGVRCLPVVAPLALAGCQTAPHERVAAVQSLKSVGQSAEAAIALSARLYADGRITAAQARAALDFFDLRFQPAFRVAVAAVQSDLNSFASPEIVSLAGQLSALVISFQK